jgi:O-acetylhomoserine (thiol)-lyase
MLSIISAGRSAGPNAADPASFESQIDENTRAIFIESLANPGGTFVDIAAIADVAHKHGLPLIVDNTMASPYLIRPIEHGADIVVHSLTKFLGGHGNSMGGIIVDGGTFDWSKSGKYPMLSSPRPEYNGVVLHSTFGNFAFAIACRVLGLRDLGPAISPFNAFLILTGIETLPLRMQRHSENAATVAKWLKAHSKIAWVNYSGLEDDPNHALQQRYSPKGAGSVFTFGVKGGYEAGKTLVEGLQLFSHLANIGDTRSLVIHPASTTHRQLTDEQKTAAGAGPDVVRLSIGIEDVKDIIADLEQSLQRSETNGKPHHFRHHGRRTGVRRPRGGSHPPAIHSSRPGTWKRPMADSMPGFGRRRRANGASPMTSGSISMYCPATPSSPRMAESPCICAPGTE